MDIVRILELVWICHPCGRKIIVCIWGVFNMEFTEVLGILNGFPCMFWHYLGVLDLHFRSEWASSDFIFATVIESFCNYYVGNFILYSGQLFMGIFVIAWAFLQWHFYVVAKFLHNGLATFIPWRSFYTVSNFVFGIFSFFLQGRFFYNFCGPTRGLRVQFTGGIFLIHCGRVFFDLLWALRLWACVS